MTKKKQREIEALRAGVRQVLVARKVLERTIASPSVLNTFGKRYVEYMGIDVMKLAAQTHPKLPYYLAIRAI